MATVIFRTQFRTMLMQLLLVIVATIGCTKNEDTTSPTCVIYKYKDLDTAIDYSQNIHYSYTTEGNYVFYDFDRALITETDTLNPNVIKLINGFYLNISVPSIVHKMTYKEAYKKSHLGDSCQISLYAYLNNPEPNDVIAMEPEIIDAYQEQKQTNQSAFFGEVYDLVEDRNEIIGLLNDMIENNDFNRYNFVPLN
jgi:hypothetical protein